MLSKGLAFEKSDPFSIISVEKKEWLVTIQIKSKQKRSRCPLCHTNSKSIHSHYQRTLKDLPAFCNQIFLRLEVRRFYCHNKKCKRKIFTERFKEHFSPGSRISNRLQEKLLKVALLMGGNPGEKLCRALNIEVSSSSLIRLIHKQKLHPIEKVSILGIDDWASKKRLFYGTCLVDLNRHQIVDLLPDREPSSVETWLLNHPEIKIVSRDRYTNYAKGIAQGAPQAAQVTDRWHLLKNLGDALQKVLDRNHQQLKHARRQEIVRLKQKWSEHRKTKAFASTFPKENQSRLQRAFYRAKEMFKEGCKIRAIARELHLCRNTVKKYLALQEPPIKKPFSRVNIRARMQLIYEQQLNGDYHANPATRYHLNPAIYIKSFNYLVHFNFALMAC